MAFEFATATRILFGAGMLAQLGPHAAGLGRNALVVTGRRAERADRLLDLLRAARVGRTTFSVPHEPTIALVEEGVALVRASGCDLIISIGGGSVIDAGKAIAALAANPGDPFHYLEVIGDGRPLEVPSLPFVAIPTTAGTGAEVTRNAVLTSPAHHVKVSLRSAGMLPRLAIVDPELTVGMPPAVTATTGLDALTQVIEPYVSHLANPITDGLCREGIRRAARSLQTAYQIGTNLDARTDMALASLLGGLSLANAGLGAVHGFAGPLGGELQAPHGAICGRLLPFVCAANIRALRQRAPDHEAIGRYDQAARWLTGRDDARAGERVEWLQALCANLEVPGLGQLGLRESAIPGIVEKAARASSMKANPIALTPDELSEILFRAL
ncbi:MAG TPA: iron-containing alcohol dehydrogenase [Symbiobacteriaceae bacterium]|nr:iron-containing alcohol dehydrogenase [Symbiobacteriaceae bacterium]